MGELKSEQKTIAKGIFWGIFGNVTFRLISFIYTVIVVRLFLPQDLGTFYLSLGIMYIVALFADLGLNDAIYRFIPYYIGKGEKNKIGAFLNSSYLYLAILAGLVSGSFFLSSGIIADFFKNAALRQAIQYMALYIFFSQFLDLNVAFITSLKKFKENQLLTNSQNFLRLILTVLMFFLFGSGIMVISFSFVLSYIIIGIIAFLFARKALEDLNVETTNLSFKDQIGFFKEVVPFGLTITLINSFWNIGTYVSQIIFGYLITGETAAIKISIYAIAIAMSSLITIFAGSIWSVLTPVTSELFGKGDDGEIKKISLSTSRWYIFLTIPMTIIFIVFPESILNMFYGSVYAAGGAVLAIAASGVFIRGLSNVQGALLASRKIVKVDLYSALVAMIINVALSIILIPKFGIEGAAIASTISFFAITILVNYYSKKITGFGFSSDLLKPLLAGILTLFILFILKPIIITFFSSGFSLNFENAIINTIIQKCIKLFILGIVFLLASMLYAGLVFIIGGFEKDDTELFMASVNKIKNALNL